VIIDVSRSAAYACVMTNRPATAQEATDALRTALAMVRADWQEDQAAWSQLWAAAEDREAVAAELTRISRELLEKLGHVATLSTGEMLHRLASTLIPHPDPAPSITLVDLDEQPSHPSAHLG
jgi:hypothetical protein